MPIANCATNSIVHAKPADGDGRIGKRLIGIVAGGLRGSVVASVVSEFSLRGGDADAIMQQHGLTPDALGNPGVKVPLARYVSMFEAMAEQLADPLLGARLGLAMRPIALGPAGMVMARSRSIMTALERLTRFFTSFQPDTQSALSEGDGELTWTYRLSDPAIWPRRQDAEFTISSQIQFIRSAFLRHWRPLSVQFEHGPLSPQTTLALERLLGCPIRFEAASNGIILTLDDARANLREEDADLMATLEGYLADIMPSEIAVNWTSRVLALIATRLGQRSVTLEDIALDLATAPRSLQRRLAEEGTSMRQLLRDHRKQVAELHLRAGVPHLGNLAAALGYADGTTFWRAHRGWQGVPPSAARSKRR